MPDSRGAHDCGANFAVDLALAIKDPTIASRRRDARDCAPTASAGGARAGTDTLTVRHASLESGRAARRTAAALFAPSRSRRRSAAVRRWPRARARGSRTTRSTISRCALTTSPTTRWSGRLARAAREGADGVARRRAVPRRRNPARRRRPAGRVRRGHLGHRWNRASALRRAGFSAGTRGQRGRGPVLAAHSRRRHRTRLQRRSQR